MGIQYVTVKVDTSGLFQPVGAAVGVVGIIGPAPSAGPGFSNPTLFTRALTGAGNEPYARVVPVLRVATAAGHAPLDPTGNAIANTSWAQPKDSHNNVIGPYQLVDTSVQPPNFEPLSVDVATRTLRRRNGAIFQAGDTNATIVIDYFSIASKTVTGAAQYWGVPLDTSGQPVSNLLMKPDADPATSFVDLSGTALTIDGTLGVPNGGTGKPKGADGTVYYRVTFDICPLAKSINLALNNGALKVWAYRLDSWDSFDASSPALADFSNRQINLVCLSANSNPDQITTLRNHVEASSPNDAGGGGTRPRMGIAMLPEGGEGFTADGTGERLYIDIVRTIDDIAFRLKATLTSPQVIGTLRINRSGLRILTSIVRAMLNARVAEGEIDSYAIDIPIQAIAEKDPKDRTAEEQQQLQQVQNSRQLAFNVSVGYAGAIHQLVVTLKFI